MDMSKLSKSNLENIVKEVRSHSMVRHPNIIELIDHMKDGNMIYLLLDYAENGNLFNHMNSVSLSHTECCKIFVQMVLAIEHIHSKGYIHRDIKPENIFLDRDMNALLGDFGWCSHISDTTYRYQKAGTYEYMSPEGLHGKLQGREVDVWALGILLYELFHNKEPFPGRSSPQVLASIEKKAVEFFMDVPHEAKDLIVKILVIDPKKRPTLREILNHDFVKKYYHEPIPMAPTGVENFPQSPGSSRHGSPLKNQLAAGTPTGSTSFKFGSNFAEAQRDRQRALTMFSMGESIRSIELSEKSPAAPSLKQPGMESKASPQFYRQNTNESLNINSGRFIQDVLKPAGHQLHNEGYSLRDVKSPLDNPDRTKNINPLESVIKVKPTLPIRDYSREPVVAERSSPLRATMFSRGSPLNMPAYSVYGANGAKERARLNTELLSTGRPSGDLTSPVHQNTPAISVNNHDAATVYLNLQPANGLSPSMSYRNFRFETSATSTNQSFNSTVNEKASPQLITSPRVVISSTREVPTPDNRSPTHSYSASMSGPRDPALQRQDNIKLHEVQDKKVDQEVRPRNITGVQPPSLNPLTIGQQYRPTMVVVNTNPVRKTVPTNLSNPFNISPQRVDNNERPQYGDNGTFLQDKGFPGQIGSPLMIDTIIMPAGMQARDHFNFDSSVIKTTASSSTEESKRIALEADKNLVSNVAKPYNFDGSNRLSNESPNNLLDKHDSEQLLFQGDKKVGIKRRTSDGYLSNGSGSPAKESSPMRNALRVNNLRSSDDRPDAAKLINVHMAHNEASSNTLLRASPVKMADNTRGFFQRNPMMRDQNSMDSDVSWESDNPNFTIPFRSKYLNSHQVDAPLSPNLARAITVMEVTSKTDHMPVLNSANPK